MTNQSSSREPLPDRDRTHTARIQLPLNGSISLKAGMIGIVIMSIFPLLYFPFAFFQQFYSGNNTSVSIVGLTLLSVASGMLYFFLVMPYHLSSIYLRYAMLVVFLIAIAAALLFIRSNELPFWPVDYTGWSGMLPTLIVIGFFGGMSVWVLRGYIYRKPAIELAFPLRSGYYVVGQGGSNAIINHHAGNPAQRYANDILKLDRWGKRARGIYPKRLDAYSIFGDTVYSPCDGIIATVIDGLPDLAAGEMDSKHPFGNHVIIKYGDRRIFLAHLQQDSMLVYPGEEVHQGQPIGKVGNSGNTSEPHLHIHAEYRDNTDGISVRMGIPIIFKEKGFLKRNDLLIVRDKIPMESKHG